MSRHPRPPRSLVQFDCTNTLNDQTLENITVQLEPTEAYEVLCYVPARSLPYNQPGTCYTLVALPKEDPTAGEPLCRCPPGLVGAPGGGWLVHQLFVSCQSFSSLRSVPRRREGWLSPGAFHTSAHFLLIDPWGAGK